MTVPVQSTVTSAIANGVTTVFPFAFKVADADDLSITLDGVEQTSGFTVAIGATSGTVTFSVAPANAVAVVIALDPILKRETDYQQFGPYDAEVMDTDFDRLWLAMQKFAQDYIRALKLPVDTLTDQLIDYTPGERASSLLSFDSNGNLDITPLSTLAVTVSAGSFTTDTFDGTGAQTAFTLSRAPGIKGNTYVFVDGVYLRKDQYEISATTITFDVAPALGTSNIEVCQSIALTAVAPADGTVTVASLAAGALAATVAGLAKMADGYFTADAAGRAKFADKFVTLAKMADMATDKLLGNISGLAGAPAEVGIAQVFPQVQPVTATVAANALTIGLNPTRLDFRSPTLTTGVPNLRHVTGALSLVVSSGSTLGTVNATAARLAILAIDATSLGGSVELAVVNLAGGNNLDETTLISTTAEGGAGAADSASTIYSATARASVPFRVVGFVYITEATAGTWATAPTLVHGVSGQSVLSGFGFGQSWNSVVRATGTTYYNTTGKPLVAKWQGTLSASGAVSWTVNGVAGIGYMSNATGSIEANTASVVVPPGGSYSLVVGAGTFTGISAFEFY